MNDLIAIIETLQLQRGLNKQTIISAIAESIKESVKKKYPEYENIDVKIDETTGEVAIFSDKIDLTKKIDASRIGAQLTKQTLHKKLYELEKTQKFEQYKEKIGTLLYGKVLGFSKGNVILDFGDSQGILLREEKPYSERQQVGHSIYVLLKDIQDNRGETKLICSRIDDNFVRCLFKKEVEEVAKGIVEIKTIAREPGIKTKISVISHDPKIEPTGACIGPRGSRIKHIVRELGEKIDVIMWDNDIEQMIKNCFKPLMPLDILRDEEQKILIINFSVSEHPIAVGKKGINVRLISKLINEKIIIEKKINELEIKHFKDELLSFPSLNEEICDKILEKKIYSLREFSLFDYDELLKVTGLKEKELDEILNKIKKKSTK